MQEFNLELFKNISDSDISPVYSWVWNSPITKELIDKQLDEMVKQGIRAMYILPKPKEFRPDSMVTYLNPEYLSDEFFELVKYAVERAASLRISAWLYDEGGWPSGNACGTIKKKYPDSGVKRIIEKTVTLKKGDTIESKDCIAVFSREYKKIDLPYTAASDCEVFEYCVGLRDNIFTHIIDERVLNEFIGGTYEKYKKYLGESFGGKVKAIFTDEPLIEYPYYIGDVTEFEKEYGHSFSDNIHSFFTDNLNEEQKRFRIDYIEYCKRVFDERFVKPLSDWCKSNNILYTGHFDGDHILEGEGFKRQVGNLMPHLRYMDIPGIDTILRQIFPGNQNNTFFPRFAASAAHQNGMKLSVSESFSVYGNGITFDQMRYVCNYQLVRGVNIINIMNIPSGRGNCLSVQMRPQYVPEMPEFTFRKEFNEYLSRMMYLCQAGEVECDTALYLPMRDVWAGESVESDFWKMGKELEEKQVYFDVLDDDFILNGDLAYKNIYIPKNRFMSDKIKKRLAECGAKIYYSTEGAEGLVKCNSKDIRVMKRVLDNESLYIIFNENAEEVIAEIEFLENKNGYILHCDDASVEKLKSTKFRIFGGEATAILFTDKIFATEAQFDLKEYKVFNEFDVKPILKTEFINQQMCQRTEDIVIDERFSGIASFTTCFEYDGDGNILIDLGEVFYYAEIKVNGNIIKKLVMPPYTAIIEREYLKKENTLEITVANTSANALVYADYEGVASTALGPYHERTLALEKESLGFGIKEVKLFKTEII